MNIFYGGAIQGARNREERAGTNRALIGAIKAGGFEVCTEHTTSKSLEEARRVLAEKVGPIPVEGAERRAFIRDKMLEFVEGDIGAAIFEVSVPSLGTGIEIAHAYLRPRLGLKEIPVLALYEKGFWPNKLSTMIRGIGRKKVPCFSLKEYSSLEEAKGIIKEFLGRIKTLL